MRRGEIRWYKFTAPDKRRPVLILTRNSVLDYLGEVIVAPITSKVRNIPSEVLLGVDDGMKGDCAVNLDHLQTVARARVGSVIATLGSHKLRSVRDAILFAVSL